MAKFTREKDAYNAPKAKNVTASKKRKALLKTIGGRRGLVLASLLFGKDHFKALS